jgi:hypothetical protein
MQILDDEASPTRHADVTRRAGLPHSSVRRCSRIALDVLPEGSTGAPPQTAPTPAPGGQTRRSMRRLWPASRKPPRQKSMSRSPLASNQQVDTRLWPASRILIAGHRLSSGAEGYRGEQGASTPKDQGSEGAPDRLGNSEGNKRLAPGIAVPSKFPYRAARAGDRCSLSHRPAGVTVLEKRTRPYRDSGGNRGRSALTGSRRRAIGFDEQRADRRRRDVAQTTARFH